VSELRDFLALPYEELEELNLRAKEERRAAFVRIRFRNSASSIERREAHQGRHSSVSDLEGACHMLDYDKKFLTKNWDNLTFDGSSIRGFTAQRESDLRLSMDWAPFIGDLRMFFGAGKVLVFGEVIDKGGSRYSADIRGVLKTFADEQYAEKSYTLNAANEIEGFLFNGADAEAGYYTSGKFEYVNTGAITTRCRRSVAPRSLIRLPKCSVRWVFRTKRTIRKLRRRSSRSTMATVRWSRLPIRFSSTS